MEPMVKNKSAKDKVLCFINNWKDVLRAEKWPDLFEDMMRVQSKDVGLPEDVLSKVREAAVLLAIHLLPMHRDLLYYAAREGRFEVMPTIAFWCDNRHDQQHGQTPAYIAAETSHVAAVCVLANRDRRVLYDRGPDGRTPYDILYSKFSTFLLADSRSNPPGCLYTYGENMARSLGHIPGERIPKPRFLETTVQVVQNCEISLGRYHTLMLIDGRVYSCGLGRDWKLGHGNEADVVIPREVFLDGRKIVAVSAGLSHSVVCTEKEVIVFGRNNDGQLGLKESKATLPTVAFTLKAPHIEIMRCFAGATYSAVMMSNGRCIVAGRVPWPDMSTSYWSFAAPPSPLYLHRTMHFFDNFVVTLQRYHCQTKVEVLSLHEGFCSRLQGQYDCKGVVESNMTILLRSILNVWKDPSFYVFYRHPRTRDLVFVELRFKIFSSTVFMNDIELSAHGEFIAISTVNQVAALPPALRAFISADGRNKALITCGISVDKFIHIRQPTSPTSPATADKSLVQVACTDERGKEMKVFLAQRNKLIRESEYCRSFFSRWCEEGDMGARISFVDDVHLVGDFLRYCEGLLQLNEFSESKLFDIMRFADRYMCQQLFDDALGAVLRKPLLMSTVRNLYELSRSIANPKLNDCVDYLGALLLPLMLDLGLAQQLTSAELKRMEQQYSTFGSQSSSEKFCRPVGSFVIELFKSLGAVLSQLDEETVFKETVIGFVLKEENRLPKPRRQVLRLPAVGEHSMTCENLSENKNAKRDDGIDEGKTNTEANKNPCEPQLPANDSLVEVMGAEFASINVTSEQKNLARECTTAKDAVKAVSKSQTQNSTASASADASSSSKPSPRFSSSINATHNGSSMVPSMALRQSHEQQLPSTSRIVPSRMERPHPWGGVRPPPTVSLAAIVADEAERAGSLRENNPSMQDDQVRPAEIRAKPRGWCKESCPTKPDEEARGMEEIMAAEVASQNEAKRLNDSRLADIEIEEQAIAELAEVYEAEAAAAGTSVTISVERHHANPSDPLWAARR